MSYAGSDPLRLSDGTEKFFELQLTNLPTSDSIAGHAYWWLSLMFRISVAALLVLTSTTLGWAADARSPASVTTGRTIYDYYCYQCHGYSGDAATEAASYLSPAPRNFVATQRDKLGIERMVSSITHGRPGTAMTSFAGTIDSDQIVAVAQYIRATFMSDSPPQRRYHTTENGWEERIGQATAAHFVRGLVSLDALEQELSPEQQRGRQLFLTSCITCHTGRSTHSGEDFGLRAVSYPRGHYRHDNADTDLVSGASVYRLHDIPAEAAVTSETVEIGRNLYLQNCAFCHAPDGSGRNWIGSFIEPRPRDLRANGPLRDMTPERLHRRIANGIPDTSMPAWKHVLDTDQIDAIVAYIDAALRRPIEKNPVSR